MRHTYRLASRTRVLAFGAIGAALFLCVLNFAGDSAWARARSSVDAYHSEFRDRYIARGSVYDSTNGVQFPTAAMQLLDLQLAAENIPGVGTPLPPPGGSSTTASLFDVFATLNLIPLSSTSSIDSFFDITYRIDNPNPPGSTSEAFETEILTMLLSGTVNSPIGSVPVLIRESPTLPSLGSHRITPQGDGTYVIDSFFDVFTEISLDGGATFHPANAPIHLDITGIPEPGSIVLALLALVGGGIIGRRRRG
jgi:hypothetical protein